MQYAGLTLSLALSLITDKVKPSNFSASEPLDTSVMLPNGEKKKLSKYLKRDFKFDWTTDRVSQYQKAIRNVRHDIYCVREDRDKPPMNFTKDVSTVFACGTVVRRRS